MKFIVVYKWKESLFISNAISFADYKAINLKIRRKEIDLRSTRLKTIEEHISFWCKWEKNDMNLR